MIDEYPILAVAAAFAEGATSCAASASCGSRKATASRMMAAGPRRLRRRGRGGAGGPDRAPARRAATTASRGGGLVRTHGDHRIAMSHLVLGLGAEAAGRGRRAGHDRHQLPGLRRADGAVWARRSSRRERLRHRHRRARPRPARGPSRPCSGRRLRPAGARHRPALPRGRRRRAARRAATSDDAAAAARGRPRRWTSAASTIRRFRARAAGRGGEPGGGASGGARGAARRSSAPSPRQPGGAVIDGRDIGTVIAPGRAGQALRHRHARGPRAGAAGCSSARPGEPSTYEDVLADIERRDARDAGRADAPMRPADRRRLARHH